MESDVVILKIFSPKIAEKIGGLFKMLPMFVNFES
jgi:hypothetical protein